MATAWSSFTSTYREAQVDVDTPAPDPGNSPPEDWTENLDPAELEQIAERLQREAGDVPVGDG